MKMGTLKICQSLVPLKISRFILKFTSCFDNGGEFKGEVTTFCKSRNINTISGRAYHPQSQGSVEQANKTFKSKLRAIQMETGTKEGVSLLPKIAKIINTSTNEALPRGTTPNEIWFGRAEANWPEISEKRRELNIRHTKRIPGAHNNSASSSSSEGSKSEEEQDQVSDNMELSELHQRVKENQDLYIIIIIIIIPFNVLCKSKTIVGRLGLWGPSVSM